jgi:peptidoglycan/xylan/chitin deacetylase (PgdA/CDA1 family)
LGVIQLQLAGAPTAAEQWAFETLVDLSRLLPTAESDAQVVRVELASEASAPTLSPADGAVRLARSALARVVDLAGAAAEQRSAARDRHGRVPSEANPQVAGGLERTAPVQELAEALRATVITAAGRRPVHLLGPWPEGHRWAAAFTHDLDIVNGWPLFAGLRWAELIRRGELARAAAAMVEGARATFARPVEQGVVDLLAIEREHDVRSTWFVLAGDPSLATWREGDVTYRLDAAPARGLVDSILGAGHEVGLHGSFATGNSPERMAEERARVAAVTGRAPRGIRQHFLRMTPGTTQRHMVSAGFGYDATFGFSDRAGFRLGTADVVDAWDAGAGRPMALAEAPLIWMDRALTKYQRIEEPDRWAEDALDVADVSRAHGGLWVGLWHPNVVPALGFPGALDGFRRLVREVMSAGPYCAPLETIVAWRHARRSLRGVLRPDGGVELRTDRAGSWMVALESPEGKPMESRPWPGPAGA